MENLVDALQQVPAFASATPQLLEWFVAHAEYKEFQPGDTVANAGVPAENLIVILSGKAQLWLEQGERRRLLTEYGPGSITGLLPFSRMKAAAAHSVVTEPSKVLFLHKKYFLELTSQSYEVTQQLVALMTDRVREFTTNQQQTEKLLALGTLSAGLAHELNNPAAAIARSAAELKKTLHQVPERFNAILLTPMTPAEADAVTKAMRAKLEATSHNSLSLVARSSLEDDIHNWLQDHGLEDAAAVAEILVDVGFTLKELDSLAASLVPAALPGALNWLAHTLVSERLIVEIEQAANRISGLVGAVKSYTHMDRDPDKEWTNLREGIVSTLTLLGHKVKRNQVMVETQLPPDLQQICGYPGQLNQVWMNLFDNALDAMPAGGKLQIIASNAPAHVLVQVVDSGTGIPPEVVPRIFEPFFTTKKQGEGTGLGLDIVRRIVEAHHAEIKVNSQPGHTEFQLRFPVNMD